MPSLRMSLSLLVASVCVAAHVANAEAPAGAGLYVKKGTWPATMAASRAQYLQWLAEAAKKEGGRKFQPFDSGLVRGAGPGRAISVSVAGLRTLRLVTILEKGTGNCTIWGEARLIAKDGKETPIGTLKPLAIKVGWGQLLVNKNWQNHPLRIGKRKLKHGIWVHTNSEVSYALGGKYERFEAWGGLDADRATGAARFKVLSGAPDLLPALWQDVAKDYPVQAKWLTEDAGRNKHLRWFHERRSPKYDRDIIRRVLGKLGQSGESLRKELDTLSKTKAPPGGLAWLALYARACRHRDCATAIRQVAVADLRQGLEKQLAGLVQAKPPADDPRWLALQSRAERYRKILAPMQKVAVETLRPSVQDLAKAFPKRFTGADGLLAQLAEHEQRWRQIVEAVVQGDEAALKQLPEFRKQIGVLQRAVRLGMEGMQEFLAAPANRGLEREWESQWEVLQHDLRNRGHFSRVAHQAHRREALILGSDRDPADIVLRRTAALLADLKQMPSKRSLAPLEKQLAELQAASAKIAVKSADARYALFAEACRLRRPIAFANPLLSFNKILFIKRHRPSFNHMCDQYYGINARQGGGLFVLTDPFGPNPQVRNVLADSVVTRGRLKGQKLEGGSFVAPDLSFDARQIVFAYVEHKGSRGHRHHTDATRGHWDEGWSYHVFKVNVDGSGLEQLTDGTWNDFDPCWLPSGRLAFITERRGGYLRCGRVCPTYTLYDMAADGSDINRLSFHETNEWHPSVTHDGRIISTRWDYVDRHGCTAHLPWITTVDGRDSRAVHGNFAPRSSRPDMELDIRAIPGSHKFVATAAPHHGQAFGSLVLIDPRVPDDDAMAPVKRLTPDVGFPESQGGAQGYATAWPLSEAYRLCVYDANMTPGIGRQGRRYVPGNYGIYLVDAFGNKELIYRDPAIACQSPAPLRPRPMPPRRPVLTAQKESTGPAAPSLVKAGEAAVVVLNVYDTLKPWPEGTQIKALRVLQVLPMSVPSGRPPHETGYRMPSAGDSVVPVRHVLGTVPVEKDGSAYFTVPANREMFFQVLDERGLAVQSMRSATYLHEGERLVCQGCHEPKQSAPTLSSRVPLALRRQPSRLKPDVDGSNPFSYPRLVQPVLDKRCVPCHTKHPKKAPNLGREPITRKWYASYVSLVPKYGFYRYGNGHRTTPGQFGARASKLFQMLEKGHHDVKLTEEELHRITLWLDCCSMFYGVYEKKGGEAQRRGEGVRPTLE